MACKAWCRPLRLSCWSPAGGQSPIVHTVLSRTVTSGNGHAVPATGPQIGGDVVFSGIQPSGVPHLGNYLGAIRQWVALPGASAAPRRLFVCVADLHALTSRPAPGKLARRTLETTAALLACGLRPGLHAASGCETVLFRQSAVRGHTELAWLLATLTSMPQLGALASWREKRRLLGEARTNVGLFTYPVLQAADILLYRAHRVPVGADQRAHLQVARACAEHANSLLGCPELFPRPQEQVLPDRRIASLRTPGAKMSKSDASADGRLELADSEPMLRRKVRRAVTDSLGPVAGSAAELEMHRPGVAALLRLLAALEEEPLDTVLGRAQVEAWSCGQLKERLAERVTMHVAPIRSELDRWLAEPASVLELLQHNERLAQETADETMALVRAAAGLA